MSACAQLSAINPRVISHYIVSLEYEERKG